MATSSRRPVEEWKLLVSRFKESGMTQKAFSKEAGIKVCSLQYWLRKKMSADDDASSGGGGRIWMETPPPEPTLQARKRSK